jgi:hypothetical protein
MTDSTEPAPGWFINKAPFVGNKTSSTRFAFNRFFHTSSMSRMENAATRIVDGSRFKRLDVLRVQKFAEVAPGQPWLRGDCSQVACCRRCA